MLNQRTDCRQTAATQLRIGRADAPMQSILQPWQLLFWILVGGIRREQQEKIDYLLTENAVLKEKLGKKRILLRDGQRRRLSVKRKVLGRKRLQEIGTLFTPDTILRWHRQLVARKWDYSERKEKRQGRPRVRQVTVDLALKFANENPSWGCDRIQGCPGQCRLSDQRYHCREHSQGPRH